LVEGPVGTAISFIIATRNRAKTLPSAVASVRAQTLPEIEVVVVDDGSIDETAAVCEAISRADPRVRLIRSQATGRSSARNLGLEAATGAWVSFLDDDDLLAPEFAARMVGAARAWGRACCCEALVFDAPLERALTPADVLRDADGTLRPRPLIARPLPDRIGLADLLLASFFPINAVIVERSLLLELGGFRPGLEFGEDYELWLRVAARLGAIPVLHEALALVRRHDRQSSRDLARMAESTLAIVRAAWARESGGTTPISPVALRRRLAFLERERSYAALLAGDALTARRAALASVRLWPLAWKSWGYLVLAPAPRLYGALRSAVRAASRRLGRTRRPLLESPESPGPQGRAS